MKDVTRHPLFLLSREYEILVNRKKRLHFHQWEYRRASLPEHLGILSDAPTIEYTQMPSARFCRKCGYIDFVLTPRKARHITPRRWAQTDLTYLLQLAGPPEPECGDSDVGCLSY